ncbi:vacuolar protein sorting-associated protein VTA1 homolog [Cylas formicarius]|uniref:vacuolar protein sorting-associated protein VTA1 homolog n=1 Tax=Cylas formicarius TaxID=197179 RepID=UPI0029588E10|nr:vacuolar protein sorting-associated protein VTA1 homolog [Cylas formicarius]
MVFSAIPTEIKPVAHLMKLAEEHESRNIVVAYWARMAACRMALEMTPGKRSPQTTALINEILNWLEQVKVANKDNDGIRSETAAQAIIEDYTLNLFNYADQQDRAEIYNKNTVKSFYTAGILFDVLQQFGPSDDLSEKRKYAKWKAAYIHNCLKCGEAPIPGPPNTDPKNKLVHISELPEEEQQRLLAEKKRLEEELEQQRQLDGDNGINPDEWDDKDISSPPRDMPTMPSDEPNNGFAFPKSSPISPYVPEAPGFVSPAAPSTPQPLPQSTTHTLPSNNGNQIPVTPEQIQKAQKYSKYATSALNYDDVKTAIDNLQKALNLLQFGRE